MTVRVLFGLQEPPNSPPTRSPFPHLKPKYLTCNSPHACRSAVCSLLAALPSHPVQGGSWPIGCRRYSLLCPVIHQLMKILCKGRHLVVAVVSLDLSEPRERLRRCRLCCCSEWWLRLAGGGLCSGRTEGRP